MISYKFDLTEEETNILFNALDNEATRITQTQSVESAKEMLAFDGMKQKIIPIRKSEDFVLYKEKWYDKKTLNNIIEDCTKTISRLKKELYESDMKSSEVIGRVIDKQKAHIILCKSILKQTK